MLEVTRRSVHATTVWLARGVDSWFGEKPFEEGGRVTQGRLSTNYLKRESESADFNVRLNARFHLPNVEERAYLYIGRDNEREEVTDTPGALTRQQRLRPESSGDRSFFAGLGVLLRDRLDLRIGFRGGLKPYAQARYRKVWELSETNAIEFRETIFWTLDDRFGSTTSLTFEHDYSSTLALRWLNSATVTQESEKFLWSSIVGLYKDFGRRRTWTVEAIVSGKQDDPVPVADYGLQTKWEQPIYKDWLLIELIVGHFWPRKELQTPRGESWAFGTGLKMLF